MDAQLRYVWGSVVGICGLGFDRFACLARAFLVTLLKARVLTFCGQAAGLLGRGVLWK